MKKLLIVTRNFPPLWGGMERLNLHMAEELSRYYDVRLVAPEGAAEHASPSLRVIQTPLKPLWRFLLTAAWKTWREARAWHPDIILAGSGLTAPLALIAARSCKARAVAYAHGLDLTAPHPVYRALWLPAIQKLDGLIANSRATQKLAENIGVTAERIRTVHPGVSLPESDLNPESGTEARQRFRAKHQLGEGAILLSVGRLTARKGLREFVADVLPQVAVRYPDIRLIVIGEPASQALYGESQSPESILAAARAAGVGERLRFLGKVSDADLADAYAGADLYVFPVRHFPHDPEGFGMVAVEAAAHGLPTVAYATGGVVDAVSEGASGYLIEPGNAPAFAAQVCHALEHKLPEASIRRFAAQFAWEKFGEKIRDFLDGRLALPDDALREDA